MVEVGPLATSLPDLLRLLVVPAFAWAALHDVRTRRVDNRLWPPLVGLGVVAGAIEGWDALAAGGFVWRGFVAVTAASLLLLLPLAYLFWYFGAFGGADAKAVMALAVVFPTVPAYALDGTTLPMVDPASGLFGLAILTNAAVLAMGYPLALAARNLVEGTIRPPMFVGRPIAPERAGELPGRLLESPDGFDRRGLDLDALRMYLAWRETTVAELRADPEHFRDRGPE
ncbi:MAG: A24 family peptidase, partial [Halobacteriales archaeon]